MSNSQKKIVLVDDVSFFLLSFKQRFDKHYKVYLAQSSEQLFEILDKVTPDLVILDINMPESNGFKIIERLKTDPLLATIPVVFLTGQKDIESVRRGMELGAVDVLFKPVDDSLLIECIENQLEPGKQETNKPIVLAVDDSPSILASINHILKPRYTVRTLPDPSVLKGLLKIITPDLFLLDCQMPDLHGFDLIRMIREEAEHEETPIVYLTSDGTVDNVSVAINLGACDLIVKPIDEVILNERIAKHLKGYMMRRRIRSLFKIRK
ncbi:MAG: response regulator [Oscillospiraceae bacterium]|jgi:PleD family two-component response regulator|nr:response regulator [Oscillospiraceae bacterium]